MNTNDSPSIAMFVIWTIFFAMSFAGVFAAYSYLF